MGRGVRVVTRTGRRSPTRAATRKWTIPSPRRIESRRNGAVSLDADAARKRTGRKSTRLRRFDRCPDQDVPSSRPRAREGRPRLPGLIQSVDAARSTSLGSVVWLSGRHQRRPQGRVRLIASRPPFAALGARRAVTRPPAVAHVAFRPDGSTRSVSGSLRERLP